MRRFAMERNPEKKQSAKSYKEAVEIPNWPGLELHTSTAFKQSGVDFEVESSSCRGSLEFLARCLVGRVGDLTCPIPSGWKCRGGLIGDGKYLVVLG